MPNRPLALALAGQRAAPAAAGVMLRALHRATSLRRAALLAATLAGTAALALPAGAAAQDAPRARVGAGLAVALLVGEGGSDFLDAGVGRWLGATLRLDRGDHVHLRVEASQLPLVPDEDELSQSRAENTLYTVMAGPQVSAAFGSLRPYLGGLAGLTVGHWETEEPAAGSGTVERSGSESTFGWGGHAGLALDVDRGENPVSFVLEGRIFDPGALLFARAPVPATGLPGTTSADVAVLSLRLGVTLGF